MDVVSGFMKMFGREGGRTGRYLESLASLVAERIYSGIVSVAKRRGGGREGGERLHVWPPVHLLVAAVRPEAAIHQV